MESVLERYRKDIDALVKQGTDLMFGLYSECREYFPEDFKKMSQEQRERILAQQFKPNYNAWYNESLALVKQLIPERLDDFISFYRQPKRKVFNYETYTISDYMIGLVRTDGSVKPTSVISKFEQQFHIIESLQSRFDSSLYEIRQLLQADLFDSELVESKVLCKNGYYRAAGALCGVVLEAHLSEVCIHHAVSVLKKNPCISDYNDALKAADVIEVAVWRHIQLLGDYRNKCDHKKLEDPTKEDIESLIAGTEKIIKTVF